MGEYQSGWGEISQVIEEHIHFMTEQYLKTGKVSKCIVIQIGFFPYAKCLGKVLMDKDWNRLNNLIYQENCFRSLWALNCGETHYWAFLDMLDALAVGNMKNTGAAYPSQKGTGNTYLSCIQTCHRYADRTLAQGCQRFGLCRSKSKKICIRKKTAVGPGDSRLITCGV